MQYLGLDLRNEQQESHARKPGCWLLEVSPYSDFPMGITMYDPMGKPRETLWKLPFFKDVHLKYGCGISILEAVPIIKLHREHR